VTRRWSPARPVADTSTVLQLDVALERGAEPIRGTVCDGVLPPREFAGWLELMSVFDAARAQAAAGPAPAVQLYMFSGSNAVQTAVLMLAHKGIEHEVVSVERGAHVALMGQLGFSATTVPALKIGERRIQGTRAIARALDDLRPQPRLFPADPVRRVRVEDAERRGEELQNAARRLFYWAILRTDATPVRRAAAEHHGATDAAARRDLAELPGRLDEIDGWIAEGVLGGDELNAADFQIAPNVAWLPCFEDLAPLVAGRPAVAYARRVAGENAAHVPAAFPRDWLVPGGTS
jgi:glutathione S-transferase